MSETFKRAGWTNQEIADIIKGQLPLEDEEIKKRIGLTNRVLDEDTVAWLVKTHFEELIELFSHHFSIPVEEMGAFARVQETGEIHHIGYVPDCDKLKVFKKHDNRSKDAESD